MVFQFQIVDADIQRSKTQVWKIDISTLDVSVISLWRILHIQRLQGRLWLLHNKTANRIQLWFSVFLEGEKSFPQENLRNKKKKKMLWFWMLSFDWQALVAFAVKIFFFISCWSITNTAIHCLFVSSQTGRQISHAPPPPPCRRTASRWRLNPDAHHPVKSPPYSTRRLVPQSFGFLLNKSAPLFGRERAERIYKEINSQENKRNFTLLFGIRS